ncbi:MAG: alginate export family protein [bacterium]|nr:alginate export family protein [bacterium]
MRPNTVAILGIILILNIGLGTAGMSANTNNRPTIDYGGSIELQGWLFDGLANKQYSWAETELYLWISADLNEKVFTKINLVNQYVWGKDDSFTLPSLTDPSRTIAPFTTGDEFELWEGYLTVKDIFNAPINLTVGRILENYGDGFVISDSLPVDAAKVQVTLGKTLLNAFVYKQVENISDISDRNLWGIYKQTKWTDSFQTDGYLLYLQDRSVTPHQRIYTIGTRANADITAVPGLTLKGELAYQTGDEGDIDFDAWGGYFAGTYQFTAATYKPAISLAYIYLSGDGDATDDENNSWQNLLGHSMQERLGQKAWGRIVDFENGIKENMRIYWIGASAQPTEKVKGDIDIYNYQYNKKQGNKSKNLGYEIDVKVAYQYTENVAAELIGAWFNPTKDYNDDEQVIAAKGAIKVSF